MALNIKSLLGAFAPPQQSQYNSLLGIDPRAARWNAVGGLLEGAGVGLMTGDWARGLEASNAADQRFQQNNLLGYQMQSEKDKEAADNQWRQQNWDYRVGRDKVADSQFGQELGLKKQALDARMNGSNDPHYGLNPIWARDASGNWQLFQPDQNGGAPLQMPFPEGVTPQPQVSFQDLGTSIQPVTNKGAIPTGQPMPKDLAGAKTQEEIGAANGKAIVAAPADVQAADNALTLIDDIRKDTYKSQGTGFSSLGNGIPGTGGYDFQNKVNQAKSGAFLSAIQQMRGMGSLSNAEGDTATAAVNRMNTATSEEAFDAALNDYEKIVKQGRKRAVKRLPTASSSSGGDEEQWTIGPDGKPQKVQ